MSDPKLPRRVFFSMNADVHLTDEQNSLKWGIVDRVITLGYAPEVFTPPPERRIRGLATRLGWSFDAVERVMRRCSAHVIIGMPRWHLTVDAKEVCLPTEFAHYEGALSYAFRLPTLIMAERSIADRIIFDRRMGNFIVELPNENVMEWLDGASFRYALEEWNYEICRRRDVFLGYSSNSRGIAHGLKRFIEKDLGASVLDWQDDFTLSDSILSQIRDAAERCSGGIFLFTKDDVLEGSLRKAAPRDNVVFEAGYFANSKGHKRFLIILESGAKMPADLGGQIYVSLEDRSNLEPVERRVRSFITENL